MGYKDYFTISVVAFLVFGILFILNTFLYFKLDIKNIIKIFIRKLKVLIIFLVPLLFISSDVLAKDGNDTIDSNDPISEIRFKTRVFFSDNTYFYPEPNEEYFSFFVSVNSREIVDKIEVYVDDILCYRSLLGDSFSKEIPIMLRQGYEPKKIVLLTRAKNGNTIRDIYYLEKDSDGPYINMDSIEVSDVKGPIGIDKRFKAFITGEDTVKVKIKDVSDKKSGINSLYFKYYTKNAEHTIKGEYDDNSEEYYAILNLPKNEKREFFIITRDNLFNISTTENDLINIIADNTLPELEITKSGNYYHDEDEVVFKDDFSMEITGRDKVGIKDILVYVNDSIITETYDICSKEGGLLKEYSLKINQQSLFKGENIIKVMARNYGGHEISKEICVYSDSSKPLIKNTDVNSSLTEIGENAPHYFNNKDAKVKLMIEDYDDSNILRNITDNISLGLYDTDGNLLDQREINCDSNGYFSFNIRADFKGYGVLRTKDLLGNELIFKTTVFILEKEDTFKKASEIKFINYSDEFSNKDINVPILVKSGFSGIREVRYKVSSPNDIGKNKEGVLVIKGKTEDGFLFSGEGEVFVTNNSNDIKLSVNLISNCGNSYTEHITLNIDCTSPLISTSFLDDKNQYYVNHNRTLKLEITERNFKKENLIFTVLYNGKEMGKSLEFERFDDVNPDKNKYIAFMDFTDEGEYCIYGALRDEAGNAASLEEQNFVIDKTKPMGEIKYDISIPDNGFINSKISAEIKIIEDNLNLDSIRIDGNNIPGIEYFTYENGVYTAGINFDKSGEYQFSVSGSDLSGNLLNNLFSRKFILDSTNPNILIYDLTNYKSYNDDFYFSGEIADENLDLNESVITLKRESSGDNIKLAVENFNDKIGFSMDKLEKIPENDGIYELSLLGKDLAGNISHKIFRFSINRFGSTFMPSKELTEISDSFTRVMGSVDIVEVNYDLINPESTRVFLFRNGNTRLLNSERDYEISSSNNGYLNSLTYSLKGDNFKEDGLYAISIYSKDNAGNINQTNRDENLISFVVDRTPPRIYSLNISSNEQYTKAMKMEIKAFDNMKLNNVTVTNNNKPLNIEKSEEIFWVNLPISEKKYNIKLIAEDMAGNKQETKLNNVSVGYKNNNIFVKSLIIIILLVILILSIIVMVILTKRRNHGKRKNRRAY